MPSLNVLRNKLREKKDELRGKENVNGVGLGFKEVDGVKTDEYAVVVFVNKKVEMNDLSISDVIPTHLDGVQTDVVEVGEISVLGEITDEFDPIHAGVSVSLLDEGGTGTLGCFVRDSEYGTLLGLSNNHVLANNNDASIDDFVIHPGRNDSGTHENVIGRLRDYIPIKFKRSNRFCSFSRAVSRTLNFVSKALGRNVRFVTQESRPTNIIDAAVCTLDQVDSHKKKLATGHRQPTKALDPNIGDKVYKTGRTTGHTTGVVEYLDAEVEVNFGSKGTAVFDDQVILSYMSDPGDSGSVICRKDDNTTVGVGLLFAGSSSRTIANKLTNVMDELNLEF